MAVEQLYQGRLRKEQESASSLSQIAVLITLLTVGSLLLTMMGLTLTATVITLVLLTPVLILFSPILIPVAAILFLTVAGFLAAGAMGVVALSSLSWIYNYLRGGQPPGSDQLDYARRRIHDTTAQIGHKAQDYAGPVQAIIHGADTT